MPYLSFDEILLDPDFFNVGAVTGSPEFANSNIRSQQSGVTKVDIMRFDASLVWQADFKDISHPDPKGLEYFNNVWYGGYGSAYGLRVRVEADHLVEDELLGEGDNSTKIWRLTKTYRRPGTGNDNQSPDHANVRRIIKPVYNGPNNTSGIILYEPDGITERVPEVPFKIFLDETDTNGVGWTIDNTTGIITFTTAPLLNQIVSWSGQFDVPMQFWVNTFQQVADFPAEVSGLYMIEILPATLGIY
jgi:hypothetical protein